MAWYRSGTVALTSGSTTVTGSGTQFLNNVKVGDIFIGPDGLLYEIASVSASAQLDLQVGYAGASASGAAYQIVPTTINLKALAQQVADLITVYNAVPQVATDAKNSASASATSAAAAATSASNAAASGTTAANAAAALTAALASFNTLWLGPHASDPSTDNNGAALKEGAMYENTSSSPAKIRIFHNGAWQDYSADAETATAAAQLSATNAATSEAHAGSSAAAAASSASRASASEQNAAASASSASAASTAAANSAANAASQAAAQAAAQAATRVAKSGDTMSGPLAISTSIDGYSSSLKLHDNTNGASYAQTWRVGAPGKQSEWINSAYTAVIASLGDDGTFASGQLVSRSAIRAEGLDAGGASLRFKGSTKDAMLRYDGSSLYVLMSDASGGDATFNGLRPLRIDTNGYVSLDVGGVGADFGGNLAIHGADLRVNGQQENHIFLGPSDGYFYGQAQAVGWYSPTKGDFSYHMDTQQLYVRGNVVWNAGNFTPANYAQLGAANIFTNGSNTFPSVEIRSNAPYPYIDMTVAAVTDSSKDYDWRMQIDTSNGAFVVKNSSTNTPGIAVASNGDLFASGNVIAGSKGYVRGNFLDTGTNDGNHKLNVWNISAGGSIGALFTCNDNTSSFYPAVFRRQDGTWVGSIGSWASGTQFNTTSDYRIKKNYAAISDASERLQRIKFYEGEYKDDPAAAKHMYVIAHELQAEVPTAVTGNKDDLWPTSPVYRDGHDPFDVQPSDVIGVETMPKETLINEPDAGDPAHTARDFLNCKPLEAYFGYLHNRLPTLFTRRTDCPHDMGATAYAPSPGSPAQTG